MLEYHFRLMTKKQFEIIFVYLLIKNSVAHMLNWFLVFSSNNLKSSTKLFLSLTSVYGRTHMSRSVD